MARQPEPPTSASTVRIKHRPAIAFRVDQDALTDSRIAIGDAAAVVKQNGLVLLAAGGWP
jgi:hypothetical protein